MLLVGDKKEREGGQKKEDEYSDTDSSADSFSEQYEKDAELLENQVWVCELRGLCRSEELNTYAKIFLRFADRF